MVKGIEKNKREMAKELLNDNMAPELVTKYTGLTVGEIEEIIRDMKN